jgi:ABC-2 type transport system permease protein
MYLAVMRLAFQRQLSYRTANLAGMATNLFWGALRAFVLVALFGAREQVAGYTVRDAVTFTGLTQALLSFLSIFAWWDVMRSIRSGEVASDLSRPADYFWYWWSQDIGRALAQLLFRSLPILGLYALVYRITLPADGLAAAATALSLAIALFSSFAWRFSVNLVAFWTRDAVGFGRLAWTVALFLSGFLMPLAFFPDWLADLMRLTPFAGMLTTPVEIYLGVLRGPDLLMAVAWQAGWAVTLYACARLLLAAGVRQLVIQGG